ncbi:hypothetical protein ON010_g3049 [Phytophthora cinnamomi]|nr:hypothetical protein ON010_g3049 [Phytophthora cinnamomi]
MTDGSVATATTTAGEGEHKGRNTGPGREAESVTAQPQMTMELATNASPDAGTSGAVRPGRGETAAREARQSTADSLTSNAAQHETLPPVTAMSEANTTAMSPTSTTAAAGTTVMDATKTVSSGAAARRSLTRDMALPARLEGARGVETTTTAPTRVQVASESAVSASQGRQAVDGGDGHDDGGGDDGGGPDDTGYDGDVRTREADAQDSDDLVEARGAKSKKPKVTKTTQATTTSTGKQQARVQQPVDGDVRGVGNVQDTGGAHFGGDERDGVSTDGEMQRRRTLAGRDDRRVAGSTLQLTDEEIMNEQKKSRLVQRMIEAGEHKGMEVAMSFGLAMVKTPVWRRVILPPALWSTVMKECHDSVWAGHLRAPHTYARIAQMYRWPNLRREVNRWELGCQESGSCKAKPREVIPPLRSIRGGDVCDRWALDVADPLPTTDSGERYVIAAVEYVTRYAVAATVKRHTAENVAAFLMKNIVLNFGAFRELLTDGAPELTGRAIEQLVIMLQAHQINPVPTGRKIPSHMEGLHRYLHERRAATRLGRLEVAGSDGKQSGVCGGREETRAVPTGAVLQPQSEAEADICSGRQSMVVQAPSRAKSEEVGASGAGTSERGRAGGLRKLSGGARRPTLLKEVAADIEAQLEHEGEVELESDAAEARTAVGAEAAPVRATTGARPAKRARGAVANASGDAQQDGVVVELRRRRRRNAAGNYVFEIEVRPVQARVERGAVRSETDDGARWINIKEYDRLLYGDRVVGDSELMMMVDDGSVQLVKLSVMMSGGLVTVVMTVAGTLVVELACGDREVVDGGVVGTQAVEPACGDSEVDGDVQHRGGLGGGDDDEGLRVSGRSDGEWHGGGQLYPAPCRLDIEAERWAME